MNGFGKMYDCLADVDGSTFSELRFFIVTQPPIASRSLRGATPVGVLENQTATEPLSAKFE
jgi:hypothetical protein